MASGLRKKGFFTDVARDVLGPLPGEKKVKEPKKKKWYLTDNNGTDVKTIPVRSPDDMSY